MAKSRTVDMIIRARDQATPAFRGAGASAKKMGGIFTGLKGQILAAFAGFSLATLAVGAVRRLTSSLKEGLTAAIETGDAYEKYSRATGMSVELLSRLSHAADISGSSFEKIKMGLKTFGAAAMEAAAGLSSYQRYFSDLGVSVTDAGGNLKNLDTLFMETTDALAAMENNTQRLGIATKLFGRAGLEMLPLLREGSKGIRALGDDAERLGITWTQTDAKAAAAFKDALTRLKDSLVGLRDKVLVPLFPVFERWATVVTNWIASNRGAVVAWVKTWLDRLKAFGGFLKTWFATHWKNLAVGISAIKNTIEAVANAVGGFKVDWSKAWEVAGKAVESVAVVVKGVWTAVMGVVAGIEALAVASRQLLSGNFDIGQLGQSIVSAWQERMDKFLADVQGPGAGGRKPWRPSEPFIVPDQGAPGAERKGLLKLLGAMARPTPTVESRMLSGRAQGAEFAIERQKIRLFEAQLTTMSEVRATLAQSRELLRGIIDGVGRLGRQASVVRVDHGL